MPDEPTFNEQMVTKLQALLLANPGAQIINVDGTSTTFVDVQARLNWFQSQVAREQGNRSTFVGINLGGFTP